MLVVRQFAHHLIDLGSSPLFKGGEARVFVFPNDPNILAKIYDKPDESDRLDKVTTLIGQPFPSPVRGIGGVVAPIDWVTDPTSGKFLGYAMHRVWNAKPILGTWSPLLSDYRSFDSRYRIARKVVELFVLIEKHPSSLIFADVNPQNALVDANDDVWLIDLDSCQMTGHDGKLLNSPWHTPEFLSPRLQNKNLEHVSRTRPDERFAIGVLLFKMMMDGVHPNDARAIDATRDVPEIGERIRRGIWAYGDKPTANFLPPTYAPDFEDLPDQIRELFSRCFVEGFHDPSLRPSAQEWRDAFSQNLISIHPAPNPAPPQSFNPVAPPPVPPVIPPPIAPVIPPPVAPVFPPPVPPVVPVQPAFVRSPRNWPLIGLSAGTIGLMLALLIALARSVGTARTPELNEERGEPTPALILALQSEHGSSTILGNSPLRKMGDPSPPLIRQMSDSVNAEAMQVFRTNGRTESTPPLIRRHSQTNDDSKGMPIRNRPNDVMPSPGQNGPMRHTDEKNESVWEHLRRAFVKMADDLEKAFEEFTK